MKGFSIQRVTMLGVALLALAACSNAGEQATSPATTPGTLAAAATATPTAAATTVPTPDSGTVAASTSASAAVPTTVAPLPAAPFVDNGKWTEGKDYFRIEPAQPKVTTTAKVEVVEVFSYGCPACNQFHATANKLSRELPADAQMVYLPASFVPQENWPMLQRAYYTALALGVADKANDAVYEAVWKGKELSAMNDTGQGLKAASALPTIEDAAKVYAKFGADPKEFVAVANSFSINTKVKRADELIKAYGVEGTPTVVVDGKYRFSPNVVGYEESIALTKWLVAKEVAGQ